MKNLMLWACGLLLPFLNPTVQAQTTAALVTGLDQQGYYSDTLVVNLTGTNQLWLVGQQARDMKDYAEKVDEVKTTFLADLTKAYQNGLIRTTSTEVYYFYNGQTSRRIKAESAEYADAKVNVAFEQTRMSLNLPKFHFTLYDLSNGQEWHIFASNTDSVIAQLSEVSLKTAIKTMVADKRSVKRATKIVLQTDSNNYRITSPQPYYQASIEIGPYVGATLIGGNLSPVLGASGFYRHTNKYGRSILKVGGSLTGFSFMSMNGTEISKVSLMQAYDGFFAINLNSRSRGNHQWFGLQAGIIKAPDTKAMNNAFKFGVLVDGVGNLDWSLDFIKTKGQGTIYGLTVKMPF